VQLLCSATAPIKHVPAGNGAEVFQRVVLVAERHYFVELESSSKGPVAVVSVENHQRFEPVRVAIGKGMQNAVIKDAEDDRRKTDAESESQNGDQAEPFVLRQHSKTKDGVSDQVVKPGESEEAAVVVYGLIEAA
jgi:hypothetical protein